MTTELSPRIVVFGVGGAGGNAVDNMIELKLQGVEFVVANTDAQALERSKAPTRIQLGPETTGGLGAGARPEVGAEAAEESKEEIKKVLERANMIFIAAGMGGGTGTGAAPIIARLARDMEILTVGVVTKPFGFEHARRMSIAESGVEDIRQYVDTLIVVPNQNLFRVANEQTPFSEAFRMVDDVLYSGVRGITDLMVMPGLINLDFADVRAVMAGMGTAMMGMGEAEGEGRALTAARAAIDNPLLDDVTMKGARGVLINITGGYDMTLFELDEAANEIRAEVATDANVIVGSNFDETLEGKLRISVVAAGFDGAAARVAAPEEVQETSSDGAAFVAPIVVTQHQNEVSELDDRPDFEGRDLPPSHIPPVEGHDRVAAEAVLENLSEDQPDSDGAVAQTLEIEGDNDMPAEPANASEPDTQDKAETGQSGFGNLFGWRKNAENDEGQAEDAVPEVIVSSPDDHPEPAPFDDADLEIPAFLRRSANH